MARATNAERAGLDAHLAKQRDGTWKIVLKDAQGQEVFEGVYGTEWTAKDKARRWVRENYQVDTEETQPRRKPRPKSLGPQPGHLSALMRARADDNEERAVALRAQADQLESEAKRLRAAADTMDGPDGQT
jgi:hypothetical protein